MAVLSCDLCGKSFHQASESSHTRHVQYCRRRAARKQPARATACHTCRASKSKCDFGQPCSRCASKETSCTYGPAPSGHSIVLPTTTTDATAAVGEHALPDDPWSLTPDNGTGFNLGLVTPEGFMYNDDLFLDPDTSTSMSAAFTAKPPTPCQTSQLIPLSDRSTATITPTLGQSLSPGCRRLLTATLRTFPRLMADSTKWPPFIHPVASELHFEAGRDVSPRPTASEPSRPLKPLAACRVIAQGFVARTAASTEFLWRCIEAEERWIRSEMKNLSPGELLAATQAAIIYTIMRLIDSGPDYFIEHEELIDLMHSLADRHLSLVPGLFSPQHERQVGLKWEDWLHAETRRRIVATCFCLALVTGKGSTDGFASPVSLPLPCPRALWEAQNELEWQKEYVASWGPNGYGIGRLWNMCDLAFATRHKVGSESMPMLLQGEDRTAEDALDEWNTGLDALGIMLSSLVGDLGGDCSSQGGQGKCLA